MFFIPMLPKPRCECYVGLASMSIFHWLKPVAANPRLMRGSKSKRGQWRAAI
jgi:hypothetical protein